MPNGCASAEENFAGPSHLGPKRVQDEVLGHFLSQYALVFAGFAYNGSLVLYLLADGDESAEQKFAGLKIGHLGLNLGLKSFSQFS